MMKKKMMKKKMMKKKDKILIFTDPRQKKKKNLDREREIEKIRKSTVPITPQARVMHS